MKKPIFFSVLMSISVAWSQEVIDPLRETQAVLTSPSEREKIFKNDKKAQAADDFAAKAVGGDTASKEELYSISSEAMGHLLKANNDDPEKMKAYLQKALNNPEEFKKSLPQDLQRRIEAVAGSQERRRAPSSKP
jgi:hypothetical protein